MFAVTRRRLLRLVLPLYPLLTLVCIVVTGNHFWMDGVGGIVVFAVGHWIGFRLYRFNGRRHRARQG
jgi:hypothetical protein